MKTLVIKRADGGISIGDLADWADAADVVERWSLNKPAAWLPVTYEVMDERPAGIPQDRFFRDALKLVDGKVEHDMPRCRDIAHEVRRTLRAEEFKPHDEVIAKQIPGKDAADAEAARAAIRDKYDAVQGAIDAADSPDAIRAALP